MKLSRKTLLLAILSNVEQWAADLRAAPAEPQPWGAVQHTIANMDQSAAMLRRALNKLAQEDTGP